MSKTIPEFPAADTPLSSSDLMLVWQNGLKRAELGDAAGLVVESGSNSDGEWIRFADGTQQAVSPLFTGQSARTEVGSVFRTSGGASQNWTYPMPFSSAPAVTNSELSFSGAVGVVRSEPSSTFANLGALSAESRDGTLIYRATAIGRWF